MNDEPGSRRDQSDLFQALVEHSRGLMCVHDMEGSLLFVNRAAAEALGFRAEDGVGWNLRRYLSPAVEAEFDGYLERIRTRGMDSGVMSLMAKDGTERHWLYHNVRLDEPGQPARVLGHAQDITDRVRAERALKESERRFRLLADTAPLLIWMSDAAGHCAFLNTPWLQFTGQSSGPDAAPDWLARVHPEDRLPVAQAHDAAIAARAPFHAEFRLARADGEHRWMLAHAAPRFDVGGDFAGLVGSCVDISELRQAREVSEEARARRIESLGVLAGGVAHEFNNLLTVITGRIQLLLDRFPADEPIGRDLELIRRSAQRAATLTQELLAFGRRQPLQPRLVDLNEFMMSLALVPAGRVDVSLRLEEPVRRAYVDPGQLKRAIVHLVENACEAMPAGGRLVVETANADLDEAFVRRHPGASVGPHVRITIRDSGAGLDEATRSRVFEPFFTARPGIPGSGLSLPAVYGITAQHGGYVTVESAPNAGTAFSMYLPALRTEGAPATGQAARGPEGPRGAETILLVEEERDVCLLLRDILEPHGYRVLEAGDAGGALALARERVEPIHLVITGMMLGQTSGPALVSRLLATRPDLKALYVAGPGAAGSARPALLGAGAALLRKPFTVLGLLDKIRQVLDGEPSPPDRSTGPNRGRPLS